MNYSSRNDHQENSAAVCYKKSGVLLQSFLVDCSATMLQLNLSGAFRLHCKLYSLVTRRKMSCIYFWSIRVQAKERGQNAVLLHQADWIAGNLHGQWQLSDYNNVLKLGYDPGLEEFPDWLSSQVPSKPRIVCHNKHCFPLWMCKKDVG